MPYPFFFNSSFTSTKVEKYCKAFTKASRQHLFLNCSLLFVLNVPQNLLPVNERKIKASSRGQLYKTLNYDLTSHQVVNT